MNLESYCRGARFPLISSHTTRLRLEQLMGLKPRMKVTHYLSLSSCYFNWNTLRVLVHPSVFQSISLVIPLQDTCKEFQDIVIQYRDHEGKNLYLPPPPPLIPPSSSSSLSFRNRYQWSDLFSPPNSFVSLRRSSAKGRSVDGACGQLAIKNLEDYQKKKDNAGTRFFVRRSR